MITKTKKSEIIKDLSDKLSRKKIAIFSDFHGVSVAKLQSLRRLLKKTGGEYKVAKKTFFDRAFSGSGITLKAKELQGELGIAFGYEDEVSIAKTLFKFSKENETFKILRGILGNRLLEDKEIVALAKLPAREILLGQLVGVLQSPMRGLAVVLGGNIRNLVMVLSKIKGNKH
ncbi:MAG: 50S ribosomal protein L10 [Parcubacteria group bacterium GW2011_GWA2_45_30]|nr:MAG: 50S ribosomal protein L10 [Parcubacteria group bacterium GW2011_GWA2_45_30]